MEGLCDAKLLSFETSHSEVISQTGEDVYIQPLLLIQFITGYKQLWHLCQLETTQWSFKSETDNFSIWLPFLATWLLSKERMWISSVTINPVLYVMLSQSKHPVDL